MTRFRFVVPVRNAEGWVGRCLASIARQRREDFRCVVMDDASTDGTAEAVHRSVAGDDRFRIERAPERRWALANIVEGVRLVSDGPEDVVLVVDGDDWLAHGRVLDVLESAYADPEVWMTYGSHQRWKGSLRDRLGIRKKRGISAPYPREVEEARRYRAWPWGASHLRTFKRFLWDAIPDADLRDEDGGYFKVCYDMAIMFPLLEMAGPEHGRYLREMLYVYNNANAQSVHRQALGDQTLAACRIRLRPPRPPLVRP